MEKKLVLQNIFKEYDGNKKVINDVSLSISDGEFVVIVGPSGCGKTTLLNIIAGLIPHDSGSIYIDGNLCNNVEPQKRNIAMVFQNYALYPTMTVYDNIAFPLKNRHLKKESIKQQVKDISNLLHISDILEKKPSQISGGQKQRVAIGRALIRTPKLLLMDEPLSNLDASLRNEMRKELKSLHNRIKSTIIYVTHDQVEALTLATRIIVLDKGVVQQEGVPAYVYMNPCNEFVASFIGVPKMNILYNNNLVFENNRVYVKLFNVKIPIEGCMNVHNQGWTTKVDVGIRADDIEIISNKKGMFQCEITYKEYLGEAYIYHCKLLDGKERIVIKSNCQFDENMIIDINIQSKYLHLFNAQTKKRVDL